jgi:predicted glutamine amidotransferase
MKRKSSKSKLSTNTKRSRKSTAKKVHPFVSGEWIFLDNGKVDMTVRPTSLNLKKLCKKFGYPPPQSTEKT